MNTDTLLSTGRPADNMIPQKTVDDHSFKLLIVDNEAEVMEMLRFNLDRADYRVVTAYSGEDALKTAVSELRDLIILDFMLPG